MHPHIAIALILVAIATAMLSPTTTRAQSAGAEQGRHCQTLLTCRYRRGGRFRGCISSFTCRTCRFSRQRCRTVNGRRVCTYPVRCGWGA